MGNEICSGQGPNKADNFKINQQLEAQIQASAQPKSRGSEYTQTQVQQMEECSPFSKFDIKFLKTNLRASNINQQTLQQSASHKNQYIKLFNSLALSQSEQKMKNKLLQNVFQQYRRSSVNGKQNVKFNIESIIKNSNIEEKYNIKDSKTLTPSSKFIDIKFNGDQFYKIRKQPINPYYQVDKKIGEGSFGSVYIGKCLKTGDLRAIKILKKKIMNENDQKSLLSQINILKKMDHINIIKLYDVFYHKSFFYVVTEYCEGGNLLQAMQNNQVRSEKDIALVMKQVASAINYMHQLKIAHRDLKLDNIVLVKQLNSSNQRTCIKIIDFGLAQQVEHMFRNKSGIVGTMSYMAPEIFNGTYSCRSDVWSCGIILCMMLIGFNPFKKSKQQQTIKSIQRSSIDFSSPQWSKVSGRAKHLLKRMLEKQPQKRISMEQVLQDGWIKSETIQSMQSLDYKSDSVVRNFHNYHRGSNFACFIKNFLISKQLTQAERQQMALIFQKIDTDSSGMIDKHELYQLYSLVKGSTPDEIQGIINRIDQNKSGRIDFQQFLLCMVNDEMIHNQKNIHQAFDYVDSDHTGFIQKQQLNKCLEGCEVQQIVNIFKEADFNGDGRISRDQFVNYMQNLQI